MTSSNLPLALDQPLAPRIADGQAVKLVGLGGVGNTLARYLSMFLASLGRDVRVVLIDGDSFAPSNTTRMFFSKPGNKAVVVRRDLLKYFADSRLTLAAVDQYVTRDNIGRLLHSGDIVLLAVDNHATRRLVDAFCAGDEGLPGLDNVCLISGGNDGVGADSGGRVRRGTYGNCQVYLRRGGRELSPSLGRFHDEIKKPADALPTDSGCVELLASAPQILPANLQTASAMLSTLWLYLCGALHYSELAFDIAEGLMRPLELPAPEAADVR